MAADPSRLPASVVRELKAIVSSCIQKHPNRDPMKPIEVTCTLRIDPESGKILTLDAVSGWEQIDGEYRPTYNVIGVRSNGKNQVFGRLEKPE